MKKKVMVVLMIMVLLLSGSTVVWAEDFVGEGAVINEDVPVNENAATGDLTTEESEGRTDKVTADVNLVSRNHIADETPTEPVQKNAELQADVALETEGEITINENNFPDANFREFVRTQFDTDGNGSFSQGEVKATTSIIMPGQDTRSVQSLKGIEYFTELGFLICANNLFLTSLDLSHNTKLIEASVKNCQLDSLKLPTNIVGIDCSGNQLTSLDISNTNMQFLWCNDNPLTSLITNSKLLFFQFNNNQLATLDLSDEVKMGRRFGDVPNGSPGHHGSLFGAFIGSQFISASTLFTADAWTVDMASIVGSNYLDRVTIVTEGAVLSSNGIVTFSGSEMPKELVYEFDTRNPEEHTPMTVNVSLSRINVTPNPAYDDVAELDWFYNEVNYVFGEGLMTGLTPTTFGPYAALSRAQFATIIHRMEGSPETAYRDQFTDVMDGQWYTAPILWANEAKIVSGYETGLFGTVDNITREQMTVMMYRYANYKGYDTSARADFSGFKDAPSVSGFARESMEWAVSKGIIFGKESGTVIDPQGSAKRAECAIIIKRFMEAHK